MDKTLLMTQLIKNDEFGSSLCNDAAWTTLLNNEIGEPVFPINSISIEGTTPISIPNMLKGYPDCSLYLTTSTYAKIVIPDSVDVDHIEIEADTDFQPFSCDFDSEIVTPGRSGEYTIIRLKILDNQNQPWLNNPKPVNIIIYPWYPEE